MRLENSDPIIEVDATLDLLSNGCVILDDEGDAWQKVAVSGWIVAGGLTTPERPTLPAKLIHSPHWARMVAVRQ